jgi:CheY-like chemotaxis protein
MLLSPAAPKTVGSTGFQILIVDDHASILNVITAILRRVPGLHLTVESSPLRALELIRSQPAHYDLLITDFRMPEMNGAQLATACRLVRPDLPVLAVTTTPVATLGNPNFSATLAKPFTPDELVRAVLEHLNSERQQHRTLSSLPLRTDKNSTGRHTSPAPQS